MFPVLGQTYRGGQGGTQKTGCGSWTLQKAVATGLWGHKAQ